MTRLIVYSAAEPAQVQFDGTDFDRIADELAHVGAHLERWKAARPLAPDAGAEDILSAYRDEIERLKAERFYATADVVRMRPGHPDWPALRQKFLAEHVHDEDEVRFFVEGSGAFYLHIEDKIYEIIGTADDLLSVPRGTKHWFDGGPEGHFTVIRLFTDQKGWVAHYTGDPIAESIPKYELVPPIAAAP